ncbi:hypothetical protein LZL87_014220 [Fusarium oxysporum]|nr:hypothetical protein LZL87_014220 [Fusarium oxysporum]
MSGLVPSRPPSKEYNANGNVEQSCYTDYPPAQYQITPSFSCGPGTYPYAGPSNTESISSASGQSSLADMAPIWSPSNEINGDGRAFFKNIRLEPTAPDISKSTTRSTADRVQSW